MRTWDKSKPPTGPFALNRDAPQAENLIAWYPMGGAGKLWVPDYAGSSHLTMGTDPGLTVGQAGSPVLPLVAASSHYLEGVASAMSALPLTVAGWCNTTLTGATGAPICIATNGGNARIQIQKDTAQRVIGAGVVNSAGSGNTLPYTYGSVYTDNVDFHAAAVYASSTSRQAFLNGIGSSIDTASVVATGMDRIVFGGRRNSSSVGIFWGGHIGEWGVWAQADDVNMIALRADPGSRFELWYPLRSKRWISLGAGPVTHTASGSLTGGASTLAGTSARLRAMASSGALAGAGSVINGTATHLRPHATSGALTGQASTLSGTANRFRAMASSGVLTGQASQLAGSASRSTGAVTHSTPGALTGDPSTVSGVASRFRAFATTGALATPGAVVAGSAARSGSFITHSTSGALAGQGSAIAGVATYQAKHTTSGALVGQASQLAGTAARTRVHDTTGALTGQAAQLSSTASRFRAFGTSGAINPVGASLSGTATRFHYFASTGVLAGQGSTVSGAATRNTTGAHVATGALSGQGSLLVGSAIRMSSSPRGMYPLEGIPVVYPLSGIDRTYPLG